MGYFIDDGGLNIVVRLRWIIKEFEVSWRGDFFRKDGMYGSME